MKKYKNIAFMAWRPYLEDSNYYKEWLSKVIKELDLSVSLDDIHYISTDELLGKTKNYDLKFYIGKVINKNHIISLNFSNFKFFLKNVLPNFDIIITSQHHYPFILLLNKYAKKYNVEVILVQHGIRSDIEKNKKNPFLSRLFSFFKAKKEYYFNVIGLLKQMIYSIFIDYKVSYILVKNLFSKRNALIYPKFLEKKYKFSKIYVYSLEEYDKYLNIYDKENIFIMGDPDVKLYIDYIKSLKPIYKQDFPYVIYIDQGIIGNYISYEDFNKFVEIFVNKGYDFFFLERPRTDEKVNKKYLHKDIKYLPPRSINKYINNAEYVISHWSTLLNLSIYLNKQTIILINEKIESFLKENGLYEKYSNKKNIKIFDIRKERFI